MHEPILVLFIERLVASAVQQHPHPGTESEGAKIVGKLLPPFRKLLLEARQVKIVEAGYGQPVGVALP